MDEIWQRHKTFILQCIIGGLAFLIALVVMSNSYSGTKEIKDLNVSGKRDLDKRIADGTAPSAKSIAAQKQKAEDAKNQIRDMSAKVASLAQDEDYVRENIVWILSTIEKPAVEAERFLTLYKQLPQTCLTSVREEARSVLVGRAAQKGRQIDESFGLSAGVDETEVPGALHALAIVCDVMRRALDKDGIQAVSDIRVNPRNAVGSDLSWISGVDVRVSLVGDPDDVMSVIRSFNQLDPKMNRMTVVREVESILRRSPDEDTVKASIALYGLQQKGAQGEDR
ncbi:MAG: hypothetical protein K8T90_00475 [Planctomycetes bacterium]|nr:hypothetical protein [Planctomycetota bacterium]